MKFVKNAKDSYDIVSVIIEKVAQDNSDFFNVFCDSINFTSEKNIFDWVKKNVVYKTDKNGTQIIKSKDAILREYLSNGKIIGDCKTYTILISGILKRYNKNFVVRFCSFDTENNISHVYIVTGNKVLDCCEIGYNIECDSFLKTDFNFIANSMTKIYTIEGVKKSEKTEYQNKKDTFKKSDFSDFEFKKFNQKNTL